MIKPCTRKLCPCGVRLVNLYLKKNYMMKEDVRQKYIKKAEKSYKRCAKANILDKLKKLAKLILFCFILIINILEIG